MFYLVYLYIIKKMKMKNLFLREKVFKNIENKAYCIQISLNKVSNFLYAIFDLDINILSDNYFFNFYFVLFGEFLRINIGWSRKCDHAGFRFDVDFLWFMFNIGTYDTRHWDDENDRFEVY